MPIISAENTNKFSTYALSTAFEAGALALTSTMLANPIGAVGGALLGAGIHLSKIALLKGGSKALNTEEPGANTASKVLNSTLSFFGANGIGWAAIWFLGYPIALPHMIVLGAASVISSEVLGLAKRVLNSRLLSIPARPVVVEQGEALQVRDGAASVAPFGTYADVARSSSDIDAPAASGPSEVISSSVLLPPVAAASSSADVIQVHRSVDNLAQTADNLAKELSNEKGRNDLYRDQLAQIRENLQNMELQLKGQIEQNNKTQAEAFHVQTDLQRQLEQKDKNLAETEEARVGLLARLDKMESELASVKEQVEEKDKRLAEAFHVQTALRKQLEEKDKRLAETAAVEPRIREGLAEVRENVSKAAVQLDAVQENERRFHQAVNKGESARGKKKEAIASSEGVASVLPNAS